MNNNHACHILLVDPDDTWLDFAMGTLQEQGIRARVATGIDEAEQIPRITSKPQLVLVDLEFAERVPDQLWHFAESKNRYVVVLFPTDLTPYRMSRVVKLGVYDCVGKPYDAQSLLVLVKSLAEEISSLTRGAVSCLAPNGVPVT